MVGTGLHVNGLSAGVAAELKAIFLSVFDSTRPFAGLTDQGTVEVKAPNIQYIGYGLLDQGMYTEAEQMINLMTRDIARSGVFSEVYFETPTGPRGGSVAPSIFGNIHFIDNVWLNNGVRMDLGEPALIRLSLTTGGVSGLKYQGVPYSVDVDGEQFNLSGDAVEAGLLTGGPLEAPLGATILPGADELSSSIPVILGSTQLRKVVSVDPGKWTEGATFAYQWSRNGEPIPGATDSSYRSVAADKCESLTVTVTGSKAGYDPVSKTSAQVTITPGKSPQSCR